MNFMVCSLDLRTASFLEIFQQCLKTFLFKQTFQPFNISVNIWLLFRLGGFNKIVAVSFLLYGDLNAAFKIQFIVIVLIFCLISGYNCYFVVFVFLIIVVHCLG